MKKIEEVTYLRIIAMVAVVSIHVLNMPISLIDKLSVSGQFFYVVRSLLIFAVPCFLFLSMMMVSLSSKGKLSYKTFYQKRSYRLLVPYLLWTVAYLVLDVIVGKFQITDFLKISNWINWFIFGKAWGHLYFLPILIELLILLPILLPLAIKVKESFLKASLVAFLPQIGIYWLNKLVISKYFSLFTSTGIWYYYIGFLGLWFGLNYQENLKKAKKILPLLVILVPIYTMYSLKLQRGESFHTFYYSMVMFSYTFLMIILGLGLGEWLKKIFSLSKPILFLERYSFGIYLLHPALLLVIRHFISSSNGGLWLLGMPLITLILIVISAYIVKITTHFKYFYGMK